MPYPKLYLLGPSHVTWSILFDTCSPPNTTYIQLAPLSYLFKGNISLVERGLKRTNKFYSRHSLCLLPFLVLRLSLTLPSWSPCNLYQLTWICTTEICTNSLGCIVPLYHSLQFVPTHWDLYQPTADCCHCEQVCTLYSV